MQDQVMSVTSIILHWDSWSTLVWFTMENTLCLKLKVANTIDIWVAWSTWSHLAFRGLDLKSAPSWYEFHSHTRFSTQVFYNAGKTSRIEQNILNQISASLLWGIAESISCKWRQSNFSKVGGGNACKDMEAQGQRVEEGFPGYRGLTLPRATRSSRVWSWI